MKHRWRFTSSNGRRTEHTCGACGLVRQLERAPFGRRGWRVAYLAPDGMMLRHGSDARTRVPHCPERKPDP